jgi:hypothetical protein
MKDAPLNGDSAVNTFDTIVLRSGNNRCWARFFDPDATAYTEDQWYRNTQITVSGIGAHGNFAHLYINGLCWGLYNLAERPDEPFRISTLAAKKAIGFPLTTTVASEVMPRAGVTLSGR